MLYNNYRIARIWDTEGIDLIENMNNFVRVEVDADGAYFHLDRQGDKSIKFVPMHSIGGVEYFVPEPLISTPGDGSSRFSL